MTDRPMPPVPNGINLTPEQIEAISGGDCTWADLQTLTAGLKQSYDNLVDFTSYVIERVVTSV